MLAKLKHLFTQTRLPYALLALVAFCGVGWEYNTIINENQSANQTLRQWRTDNHAKVHRNEHQILKYHTLLDAISDEKNAYLNKTMMQPMLQRMATGGNPKNIKMPNLDKDPQYVHLDRHSQIVSNHANNRIAELRSDNLADKRAIHHDHNHSWVTNSFHPQKAPIFQKMAGNGAAACMLLIIGLFFLTYTAKFKDIQRKRWHDEEVDAKHKQIEAERQQYIKEFGDDKGFDPSNYQTDSDDSNHKEG